VIEVPMPRLSDSMEEGTIIRWLVEDGQAIADGDELVEIETDKAATTHIADCQGVIRIIVPAGAKCAVGTVIAHLEPIGFAGSEILQGSLAAVAPVEVPSLLPPSDSSLESAATLVRRGTAGQATPLARRAAAVHGVDLETVAGNGPTGRITLSDVLATAGITEPASASVGPPPAAVALSAVGVGSVAATSKEADTGRGTVTLVVPSRLQKIIAERMVEANDAVPAFQVQTEVNFNKVIAFRQSIKDIANDDPVPSLNDFAVKAAALALRQVPSGNASYADERFELHGRINIGVAVAADAALVVPTIFDADTKSLGTIAAETRQLADRVRSGSISPSELSGGTFTVSNLGMYGMTAITPIINPPQAAILGVGAAREVLARVNGEIVDLTMVTLTLSCDHRILYGADAAHLLAAIQALLETPLSLAL
jgi:pyruvate dehydrogenase E2 component (dihydrolipoamide acetyltransferase)